MMFYAQLPVLVVFAIVNPVASTFSSFPKQLQCLQCNANISSVIASKIGCDSPELNTCNGGSTGSCIYADGQFGDALLDGVRKVVSVVQFHQPLFKSRITNIIPQNDGPLPELQVDCVLKQLSTIEKSLEQVLNPTSHCKPIRNQICGSNADKQIHMCDIEKWKLCWAVSDFYHWLWAAADIENKCFYGVRWDKRKKRSTEDFDYEKALAQVTGSGTDADMGECDYSDEMGPFYQHEVKLTQMATTTEENIDKEKVREKRQAKQAVLEKGKVKERPTIQPPVTKSITTKPATKEKVITTVAMTTADDSTENVTSVPVGSDQLREHWLSIYGLEGLVNDKDICIEDVKCIRALFKAVKP